MQVIISRTITLKEQLNLNFAHLPVLVIKTYTAPFPHHSLHPNRLMEQKLYL